MLSLSGVMRPPKVTSPILVGDGSTVAICSELRVRPAHRWVWRVVPLTEASAQTHVIEQILDRVLSGWRKERPAKDKDFRWLREQASRAKAAIERQTELDEKLGDNAPEMDASNLHPWVWEAA